MIPGRLIGLEVDGHFVACETQCDVNWNNELLPASNPDTGRWRKFIEGVRDWSVTVNANLVLDGITGVGLDYVLAKFLSGGEMGIKYRTLPGLTIPEFIISGNVLIRNGNTTAPSVGNSTWMVNMQGNGAMNANVDPFANLIINAMPPDAEWPLIVEEDPDDWPTT